MSKKKLLTMVLALVLIGAVGVGATLAYFTDNDSATNVVTMGHVDIELKEDAWKYDKDGISGVTPGQVIPKDPTITLVGDSLDAYVRIKLEVTGFEGLNNAETYKEDVLKDLVLGEGWTKVGDYFYYGPKLTGDDPLTEDVAENATTALFESVTIPYEWTNDVANATFNILVSAEAIQADNLEDGFRNADGSWNIADEDVEKVILPYEE